MVRKEQAQANILAYVSPDSTIDVSGYRLRLQNDLGQLPLPIFDSDLQTPTTIPFVFLSQPSTKTLEAAGVVASWFGLLASSKPVRFTASVGNIPTGDVVLFSDQRSSLPGCFNCRSGTARSSLFVTTHPTCSGAFW